MKKRYLLVLFSCILGVLCFAASQNWTFNSDTEGWATDPGTWNSTVVHDAIEGHTSAGSIHVTDSNYWCGVQTSVTVGTPDPPYSIETWVKLMSSEGSMRITAYEIDKNYPGGMTTYYSSLTTGTWQTTIFGGTGRGGYTGYIQIHGGSWGSTDPATIDFFVDDVSYTEGSGITDWALFKE